MDCFIDEDTKVISTSTCLLQYHCDGFDETELCEQVECIVSAYPDVAIVVGTGFENKPELLECLTLIAPVIGNEKKTVQSLKDPVQFAALLESLSINTPETSLTQPLNAEEWLLKVAGAVGGGHVRWLSTSSNSVDSRCYFQKYIEGVVSSAIFLATGTQATVIGFNEQLQSNEFQEMPFLYKGAVSVNEVTAAHKNDIDKIVNSITREAGLKGLCGIDYIITASGKCVVLEINPRPPASYVLHEQAGEIFNAHLACFLKKDLEYKLNKNTKIKGYAIHYASERIYIDSEINWPNWVSDIPPYGSFIEAKYPVCTVSVEADLLDDAKLLLEDRLKIIRTTINAGQYIN